MKKRVQQAFALMLILVMLMGCVSALAAEDQTSGTVPVTITADTPTFSVTMPTALPIHMDAYGSITCENITITNNSAGSVLVKDTQLTALNGWTLENYATTTFTDADIGQHRVALRLDRGNGRTAGGSNIGEDFIPAGGGKQTVSVAAKLPYQGIDPPNTSIAQVVFVLGWHKLVIPLTGMTISGPNSVSVDETIQLTAAKQPANTTTTDSITWSSSNTSVATVSNTGVVTGKAKGVVTITARCAGVSEAKTVTVTDDRPDSISGITLAISGYGCSGWTAGPLNATRAGNLYTTTFFFNATGEHSHDHALRIEIPPIDGWKISYANAGVAASSTGRNISLIQNDGIWQGKIYWGMGWPMLSNCSFDVQVSFSLTKSDDVYLRELNITGGDTVHVGETISLSAAKVPTNTTDTGAITWSSSNTSVATVNSSGVVTGVKAGTATITASCNGVSATKSVTVEPSITLEGPDTMPWISLSRPTAKLTLSDGSSASEWTWTSSDPRVVSVSGGSLYANDIGRVTISASKNGTTLTKDIEVTWDKDAALGSYETRVLGRLYGGTTTSTGGYQICSSDSWNGRSLSCTIYGYNGNGGKVGIQELRVPVSSIESISSNVSNFTLLDGVWTSVREIGANETFSTMIITFK